MPPRRLPLPLHVGPAVCNYHPRLADSNLEIQMGGERLCDLQRAEVKRKGFVPETPIENAPHFSAPSFPAPSERLGPVAEDEQRDGAVFGDGAVIPAETTKVCMGNTGQYSEHPGCNSAWDFVTLDETFCHHVWSYVVEYFGQVILLGRALFCRPGPSEHFPQGSPLALPQSYLLVKTSCPHGQRKSPWLGGHHCHKARDWRSSGNSAPGRGPKMRHVLNFAGGSGRTLRVDGVGHLFYIKQRRGRLLSTGISYQVPPLPLVVHRITSPECPCPNPRAVDNTMSLKMSAS